MIYEASGLVHYYKHLAAKSERKCIACLLEDGKKYPIDVPLEDHPNGRCTLVPCVDGEDEPTWETGEAWFLKQGEAAQRNILGPGVFEKWKSNGLDVRDLVKFHQDDTWGSFWKPVGAGSLGKIGIVSMRVPNGKDISILDLAQIDEHILKERVISALKMIEEVHRIDVLGKININFSDLVDAMGNFDPSTMTITIDPRYDSIELTTIHEIAHYLDYALFGKGKNYASSNFSGISELSDWREKLFAADFYKNIRYQQSKNRNDDFLRWISKPYELFSVFYTKMIAKNMLDPTVLIKQLSENEKSLGIDGWNENEVEILVSSIKKKLIKKRLMKNG